MCIYIHTHTHMCIYRVHPTIGIYKHYVSIRTRIAQQIDERGADGAVYVEDEVRLFASGQLFHLHREVKNLRQNHTKQESIDLLTHLSSYRL